MDTAAAKYYISWYRWQAQDSYTLWLTMPYEDALWADEMGRVPLFATPGEVRILAERLGVTVEGEAPRMHDFDAVAHWMMHSNRLPPRECLIAWNAFDDLSSGVGHEFAGNRKAPVRNRVFDLLYAQSGLWKITAEPIWRLQERKVLRRILQQGFRLWQRYTYQASAPARAHSGNANRLSPPGA
ncbi:hypothetical protein [Hymenobacter sp. DG01]|uniref:hypothetical protein n=1 Tax=Hymenobacter sp. DG01 TaxID=2584940 RepID=UPI0011244324|nr:hypothetical protein [Hymenobacter sp. DG01]